MRPDSLVFDLDGTLWDTSETCAVAWNRVVRELGLGAPEVSADDMRRVAGLAHTEAVRRVFESFSESDVERVSEMTQLEDNRALAESGGILYPGVSGVVPLLRGEMPLAIVSNCQAGYIEIFLETSGLAGFFVDFECWGNTGNEKGKNLAALIERNAFRTPWFVGDTQGDRRAARENGVRFVHAAYGFGSVEECDARIATFGEIAALVRA